MKNLLSPQATRATTGGAVILFGVAVLLGNLDVFNLGDVLGTWWPLLVICAGLLILGSNTQQYTWALLVILLGVLWQLDELDVIDFNVWQLFWPLVLIVVGWSIIRNKSAVPTNVEHANTSDMTVVLGGIESKSDAKDYKGGKMSAILGGSTLDLRHAEIKKEATIDVFAFMGGIELRVPEGWTVRSSVTPILGGVENKTIHASSKNAPVLNIVGTAVMGGVEIKH